MASRSDMSGDDDESNTADAGVEYSVWGDYRCLAITDGKGTLAVVQRPTISLRTWMF
jgi:hypothetical protein